MKGASHNGGVDMGSTLPMGNELLKYTGMRPKAV